MKERESVMLLSLLEERLVTGISMFFYGMAWMMCANVILLAVFYSVTTVLGPRAPSPHLSISYPLYCI